MSEFVSPRSSRPAHALPHAAPRVRPRTRGADPLLPAIPGWTVERRLGAGAQADVLLVRRSGDHPPDAGAAAAGVREWTPPRTARLLRVDEGPDTGAAEQRWRLLREVRALRALERAGVPGVPRVLDFSGGASGGARRRPAAGRPWVVLPYHPHAMWRDDGRGGVWAETYRGDVDRVLVVIAALADTLAGAHALRRPVVHRDVHAGNVFFGARGGRPVLGDFGIAQVAGFPARPGAWGVAQGRTAEGGASSPWHWRPPEFDRPLGGTPGDGYTALPASDVFMLGGLLYQALTGGRYLPPAREWAGACVHESDEHALWRVLADVTDDPRPRAVSHVLRGMLALDPARRLPARGVAAACRAVRATPGARDSGSPTAVGGIGRAA